MDIVTIDTYNELAGAYDKETEEFWTNFPQAFIKKFAGEVRGDKKILNVGSGPGRDAELLRHAGLDVVCLDASPVMVELTNRKGFVSVEADMLALPFADNSFDGVWAYTSFLHLKKSQVSDGLAQVLRVLKPNGVLGLGLIKGSGESYLETKNVLKPRLFSFFSSEEVAEFLSDGFTIIASEEFQPRTKKYLHVIAIKR